MRSLTQWLEYVEALHHKAIDMGLDRVRSVARRLDLLPPPSIALIVAGTNGKGSTCVALEQLLLAQNATVGTALSPHLHRFNERVRVAGRAVDDACLCRGFTAVEQSRGAIELTYFEFATLVSLWVFRQAQVRYCVLEVGLGGRLDAFNIVDAQLAVVTSIGLDHQDYLGDDIVQIAREKAGVFRAGQPIVLGAAVPASLIETARSQSSQTLIQGRDFGLSLHPRTWDYHYEDQTQYGLPYSALAPTNLALAAAALSALAMAPSAHELLQANQRAVLWGRFEFLRWRGRRVIVDVGHNPDAARHVLRQLRTRVPASRAVGVLGMLRDKDGPGFVSELSRRVSQWACVTTTGPRGQTATELASKLQSVGVEAVPFAEISEALAWAHSNTTARDVILVLGSFAVVEQVRLITESCMQVDEH